MAADNNHLPPVSVDVNTTATLDQMASGDSRAAPVRKAKWHLGESLQVHCSSNSSNSCRMDFIDLQFHMLYVLSHFVRCDMCATQYIARMYRIVCQSLVENFQKW